MKLIVTTVIKSILGRPNDLFKEHMAHRYKRPEKSSVAQHMLTTGHIITIDNLKRRKNCFVNLGA